MAVAGAALTATAAGALATPLPVDLRDLPQQPVLFTGSGPSEYAGAPFGLASSKSLETRCDLDGDGVDDLVAGAAGWSIGNGVDWNHGRLHVIRGRAGWTGGTLPGTAETIAISGDRADATFAMDVVCAGDVDGDGIDDLAVGVGNNPAGVERFAHLVYGATDLFTAGSFSIGDAAGRAVAFAGVNTTGAVGAPTYWVPLGDLDGDGHDDLALVSSASGLWVVPGRPRDEISDDAIDVSEPGGGYLAANGLNYDYGSIEPVGDVDGDGADDLAIGQYSAAGAGGSQSGIVQIVSTAALSDPEATPFNVATEPAGAKVLFRVHGPVAKALAGTAIAALGDVNGDGRDDIAIGVPGSYVAGSPQTGRVYVVYGRTSHDQVDLPNLGTAGGYAIDGLPGGEEFGSAVEAVEDLNGDGLVDLLIGAPSHRNPAGLPMVTRTGAFFVVYGKTDAATVDATAPTPATGAALLGVSHHQKLGISVAAMGDLDGNGLPELVVGGHPRSAPGKGEMTILRLGDPLPDPPVDPGPGPGPGTDPGPGPGTNPGPGPKVDPKPDTTKPKQLRATGKVTKTTKRGTATIKIDKQPGAKPRKAYRVQLVRRGKTIATGTVRGKTLELSVRKVGKGKKARHPKLKGTYTLIGAKGVSGVKRTAVRIG
jgi:hypothetical protein